MKSAELAKSDADCDDDMVRVQPVLPVTIGNTSQKLSNYNFNGGLDFISEKRSLQNIALTTSSKKLLTQTRNSPSRKPGVYILTNAPPNGVE